MSGQRFGLLHKFLHLVGNTTDGPGRKVARIKPFIDIILKFMKNYIPTKNISINESLLGSKGNSSWVQYIPAKHKRFRIKFFELCESSTGYIWNFFVYAGSDISCLEKYMHVPITFRIVFSLMNPFLEKKVCTQNNFYTSPTLADMLVDCDTDTIGTVKVTRHANKNKRDKVKDGPSCSSILEKVNGLEVEE